MRKTRKAELGALASLLSPEDQALLSTPVLWEADLALHMGASGVEFGELTDRELLGYILSVARASYSRQGARSDAQLCERSDFTRDAFEIRDEIFAKSQVAPTLTQIADKLGMSDRHLRRLARKHGLPKGWHKRHPPGDA